MGTMQDATKETSYPHYWQQATAHLSQSCPIMAGLIAQYTGEGLYSRGDGYQTLIRSVVGQQISTKAADSVWAKLEKAVQPMTPKRLLTTSDERLRACGLSGQKLNYLRNVSQFFHDRNVDHGYWDARSDAEIMQELIAIKGIGSWTVEMFLIFFLNRPDIFPIKDIAILKAVDRLYFPKARKQKKPADYQKLAKRWAPYRTVASWYLWRSLDPVAVAY